MSIEDYEIESERIRKENNEYLKIFEDYLTGKNLSPKTIRRHISNVDLYINEYLLYDDVRSMNNGTFMIDGFLGDFFIRKCMWSTPENIKTTASSIKKFYKCMLENNKIDSDAYDFLCDEIKSSMDEWQLECGIYNDPSEPNPFFFF